MSGCNCSGSCSSGSCSSGSCSSGSCSGGSCSSGSYDNTLPPGMLAAYNLDQNTADGILVYIETDGKTIHPAVRGILGKAKEISSGRVFGIMFAGVGGKLLYDEIFSYGVDTLYHMRNSALKEFQPISYADAMADVSHRIGPASILFAATPQGRELAPLVAARLGAGLTADCTGLEADGRKLLMTRPALGGNILATIECDTFPQMATVRPGTFDDPEPEVGRKGTSFSRPYKTISEKVIVSKDTVDVDDDIGNANVLISLGNGVRNHSTVDIAYKVAELLGASVSCTRALVDKGWMPYSAQVGQSGRTVSPDVYMAFGISGSVQHMAGLRAKRVISVNKDRNAPLNSMADKVVVGDADSILKDMLRSLEE